MEETKYVVIGAGRVLGKTTMARLILEGVDVVVTGEQVLSFAKKDISEAAPLASKELINTRKYIKDDKPISRKERRKMKRLKNKKKK